MNTVDASLNASHDFDFDYDFDYDFLYVSADVLWAHCSLIYNYTFYSYFPDHISSYTHFREYKNKSHIKTA